MAEKVVYADSSALVKLVVAEAESQAVKNYVADEPGLWTSRLASVEVVRAAVIANPTDGLERASSLLEGCALIDVDSEILEHASQLVNRRLRTLDAIHLASALLLGPEEVVAYDSRLLEAAKLAGLRSVSPS